MGEIKDVLDKAHIEIISANILYVLKIQSILYAVHQFVFKHRRPPPTFMNFDEHRVVESTYLRKRTNKSKKKNKRNVVKKIETDLSNLTANVGAMSRQIAEINTQIRSVRRLLE